MLSISSNGGELIKLSGIDCPDLMSLVEPEFKPERNRSRFEKPKGGVVTLRDWNKNPFCVLFGNVDQPRWMKDDVYQDDEYNRLYHDTMGRPYMLVPLLKLGPNSVADITDYYQHACDIGLRCDLRTFAVSVYKTTVQRNSRLDPIPEEECLLMIHAMTSMSLPYTLPHVYIKAGEIEGDKNFEGMDYAGTTAFAMNVLIKHHGYTPEAALATRMANNEQNKRAARPRG